MKKWKLKLKDLAVNDCIDLYYGIDLHQGAIREAPILVYEYPFADFKTWQQVKRQVSTQVNTFSDKNLIKIWGCCEYTSPKGRYLYVAIDAPFGYNLEFTDLLKKQALKLNWKLRVRMMLNIASAFKYFHAQKREGQVYIRPFQPLRLEMTTESEVRLFYGDVLMSDEYLDSLEDCPYIDWDAAFLCPDVLNGIEIQNGQAADVHYLGMLMYYITVRQLPPVRTDEEAYIVNANALKSKLPSDVPAGVWALIEDCVKGDPTERPTFATVTSKLNKLYKSIGGAPEAKIVKVEKKKSGSTRSQTPTGAQGDGQPPPSPKPLEKIKDKRGSKRLSKKIDKQEK